MQVAARTVRNLIEALDASAIRVESILRAVSLERGWFYRDGRALSWEKFVRLNEEVSAAVDHDPARLRAIGFAMVHVPSMAGLRGIARTVVSVETLYAMAERWVAPANFPHLRLLMARDRGRVTIHGTIPTSHLPCEPFLRISAATMIALPTVLGHPPAHVVEEHITTRVLDLELRTPTERSALGSLFRGTLRLARRRERDRFLEEQRRALAEGLEFSRRANDELRSVLEVLPDLVVIHRNGIMRFVNRAAVRAFGYPSASDLIGRPLMDLVDPRSHAVFAERLALPTDDPRWPDLVEAWARTSTGEPILVEIAPTRAVTFDGEPARLVVGRDITERVRLQQQLATSDRLASLGLLAAGVAHEVNNPLAYFLNNIEIARKHLQPLGAAADGAQEALRVALEGVDRIRFIVRELLLLARPDTSAEGETDLPSAVDSTPSLAREEIARTASLVTDIEAVPPIHASVPRVAQIVLNLVLNALEAMRDRDRATSVLRVRVRSSGEHAVLEVTDNGIGIDPSDAGRLFDPFFTTKSPGRGTGLGLAITQRLVSELGGEISFTSEPGRGTTFRVVFPLHRDDDAASRPSDAAKATKSPVAKPASIETR